MQRNSEMMLWRLASTLTRLCGRLPKALLAALRDELENLETTRSDAKDVFDELPDPPHLDYGEVKYRDGRFKHLDG